MFEMIKELDYSPLWISLKTAAAATALIFFAGIFLAAAVTKLGRKGKMFWDGVFTLPMILPPTAMGFFLLVLFSLRRPFGAFLYDHFQIKVVQTWLGCVVAAVVVSFPLMYRSSRGALEQVDENLISAGRTLGMSEFQIFWKVVIPEAWPGIVAGTVLTFARALGEYGATSMLAGNIAGRTGTVAQVIAMVLKDGDYQKAWIWVGIMMVMAFAVLAVLNSFSGKKYNRYTSGGRSHGTDG